MLEKSATTLPSAKRQIALATLLPALIPSLLVTLFVISRIYHITTYSLWGGEAFTMIGSRQDWASMFAYIVDDIVHPPLIYIVLKLWLAVGSESVLWLKLLPAIFGIGMIVPFFLLCQELNLKSPETYLALLIMGVNGYLIHYTQELRMYSMFAFWALCSFWLFLRYFKSTDNGTMLLNSLTVVNLLAIYSHYYGWLVVAMEFLFLLIWRRKILSFGLSIAGLLLLLSPWAYFVVREARSIGGLERNLGWIPTPDAIDVLNFYATLTGPLGSRYVKLLGLALFNLPLIPWFWRTARAGFKSEKEDLVPLLWLAILSFLPVIVIYLISQRYDQAVWMDRYFIFIGTPYMILVATAAIRLPNRWVRNVWIIFIIGWSVLAGVHDLKTNRIAWASPQLGSRIDWESLARQMSEAESAEGFPVKVYTVPVISKGYRTGDWAISTSLEYYLDSLNDDRFELVYTPDMGTLLGSVDDDHFWVAYFDITDWRQRSPVPALIDKGYRVGDEIVFGQRNNQILLLPVWRK
jgi:hypothetical protein